MNSISFVGNLTGDPRLVKPAAGSDAKPRATFSVAVNEGQGDEEKTHFINVTAFGTLGENLAESLSKGQRVVVVGRFNTYSKDVQIDGDDKSLTMVAVTASAVGPDLRWAKAKVTKVTRAASTDEPGDTPDEAPAKKSGSASKATAAKAADDDDF
jgi:single-strand DNA-binding protein